jgi:hypothetical protein
MVTAELSAFVGSRQTGATGRSDTPRDDLCILTVSGIDVDLQNRMFGTRLQNRLQRWRAAPDSAS